MAKNPSTKKTWLRRIIFSITLLFSSTCLAEVPLLHQYPEFKDLRLQPHYKITAYNANLDVLNAIWEATRQWNIAANDGSFIEMYAPNWQDTDPTIVVIPSFLGWRGGIAYPVHKNMCVIMVSPDLATNIGVLMHEIGHCLDFAHQPGNKKSNMYNYVDENSKLTRVSSDLKKALREALEKEKAELN